MTVSIDLVVFDMDDVLAHLNREHRLALLSSMTGKSPAFLYERIWASDFENAAERGAYPTGAEYLAEFNRRIDGNLTRAQWMHARGEAMTVNRDVLELAVRVQRRTPIAMLTNNGSLLLESLPDIFPDAHRLFGERAHASFQFGARKPEAAVFERLLARYSVPPERALFIDDHLDFVGGSRAVGMQAIQYTSPVDLRGRLAALGVLAPAAES
jgi:glucose-1-phosphatase